MTFTALGRPFTFFLMATAAEDMEGVHLGAGYGRIICFGVLPMTLKTAFGVILPGSGMMTDFAFNSFGVFLVGENDRGFLCLSFVDCNDIGHIAMGYCNEGDGTDDHCEKNE